MEFAVFATSRLTGSAAVYTSRSAVDLDSADSAQRVGSSP